MPCATYITLTFSELSFSEVGFDTLQLCGDSTCSLHIGTDPYGYSALYLDTLIMGSSFYVNFQSDDSTVAYGFDMTATATFGNLSF